MNKLSAEQKVLICDIWKKDDFDWMFEIGTSIYSEIFRLKPSVKSLFPYIAECEKRKMDLKESKRFSDQALRFVQVLGMAVGNISENEPKDEDFDRILFQLGRQHITLIRGGFKVEYWQVFEQACVAIMEMEYRNNFRPLTNEQLKAAVDGWQIICNHIIMGMRKGFMENSPGTRRNGPKCKLM